jgi:hypothetical protein
MWFQYVGNVTYRSLDQILRVHLNDPVPFIFEVTEKKMRAIISFFTSSLVLCYSFTVQNGTFLGALSKSRKSTISFIISVCLSVRVEQIASHWTGFHEN